MLVPGLAFGWGSEEHAHMTAEAVKLMPPPVAEIIAPEAAVLSREYCEFPDENWPAYGEWGGGNADPKLPRFVDMRREWDISHYCGWNPVTREGRSYPHSAPQSIEAVPVYFHRAVESLKAGHLEDGARFLGVAMHYIEDSASFGHLQAIHRNFGWNKSRPLSAAGHTPTSLGDTPEKAADALRERMREMVAHTERTMDATLSKVAMPVSEIKTLSAGDLYPKEAVRAILVAKYQYPEAWDEQVRECALAAIRVCADVLFTALRFAPKPMPEAKPNPTGVNLVFNPSFEAPGDGIAEGWCVGWLDLADRAGRAEWYRAGTHWDKPVKEGDRSAMVLWAPEKGIEWRQTWRRAIRVRPGEVYRASAWLKSRTDKGGSRLTLQFCDTAYLPVAQPSSPEAQGCDDWTRLTVEGRAPATACWLRLILFSNADGAAWFDSLSAERTE